MIGRRRQREERARVEREAMAVEAARARFLIEESRELVLVLDEGGLLLAASRRARELFPALAVGSSVPDELGRDEGWTPVSVPYEVGHRREQLVYLSKPGGQAAYEELRAGFTAAVSHELRTPLARLLVLLETALLPGADQRGLIEQAQAEVQETGELIDDVLFLSELETGREVVALGSTAVLPELDALVRELRERAERAGITLHVEGDSAIELPLRPRMLRVVGQNLIENALRYAGQGASFVLSVQREDGKRVLSGRDDGVGVDERDVPRLFERFYRADHARASRGTGLGLAIVKHVVTSAGGTVEARGSLGEGLEIRCSFPG